MDLDPITGEKALLKIRASSCAGRRFDEHFDDLPEIRDWVWSD